MASPATRPPPPHNSRPQRLAHLRLLRRPPPLLIPATVTLITLTVTLMTLTVTLVTPVERVTRVTPVMQVLIVRPLSPLSVSVTAPLLLRLVRTVEVIPADGAAVCLISISVAAVAG
eukprot:EG_transcript_36621